MREILFRGMMKNDNLRCKRGQWVFGDLVRLQDGNDVKPHIYRCGEVLPETVGQYTGLTDKNGKKIFEGDIVVTPGGYLDYVTHHEGCFCMELQAYGYEFTFQDFDMTEVIGNIHDNPEILRAVQK